MAYIASIAQCDVLFENRGAGPQRQFDGPLHSINSVDIPNGDRCTTVLVTRIRKIHWRHRDPIVGNRKIQLDSKYAPSLEKADTSVPVVRSGQEHWPPTHSVAAASHLRPTSAHAP